MCKVHDVEEHEWRHLNFFEHLTFLKARQPRTTCKEHGVKTVTVPWSRPGSGFTLLMEAIIVELARNGMTPTAIGRIVGEHDTRIWRVLEHYVDEARARTSFEGATRIAVDETSRAKGHVYVTLFADVEQAKVLFVAEGKDHKTVASSKRTSSRTAVTRRKSRTSASICRSPSSRESASRSLTRTSPSTGSTSSSS